MINLLLAFQFLTVIPIKIKDVSEEMLAMSSAYFPFIGLAIGLILLLINTLLSCFNFPPLITGIVLAVSLIVITAGMHLDGLSDTADAFLSGKPAEKMLEIMRDPHIGVMGVLSLLSVILLKIGFLAFLGTPARGTALLLSCVLSRWAAVFAMYLFPYARKDGKAKVFIEGMNLSVFLFSLAGALLFSLLIWRLKGLLALLVAAGCTYLFGMFCRRKIGGITGDTLGANIEMTEIALLFVFCIA
ncbi:MAG: adenosylcobinamide-GDP ribazoletransferase [Candidatus Omnitrophica bacterium]|nr:adenosylcobinamide-GDP ribazoletransferase [Candidatus Omnitrophota bacterium]